jgi:hypothetical protein
MQMRRRPHRFRLSSALTLALVGGQLTFASGGASSGIYHTRPT